MNVDIEGHTDNAGDDAYNLSLSAPLAKRGCVAGAEWRRAREAQRRWRGERVPVASNDTADGPALNRRVEVRRR